MLGLFSRIQALISRPRLRIAIFMDRNTIIGFSLIFLILIGYYWWTAPTPEEKAREQAIRDSVAAAQAKPKAKPTADSGVGVATVKKADSVKADDSLVVARSVGGFARNINGNDKLIVLKNKSLTVGISTKGGSLSSVNLNKYKRSDGKQLNLIDKSSSSFGYELTTRNGILKTNDFYWNIVEQTDSSARLRLDNGAGAYIDQVYKLNSQDFLLDYDLELHGMQNEVLRGKPDLNLKWQVDLFNQEKDSKWEKQNSYIAYKLPGEDPDKMGAGGDEEKEEIKGKVQWVSFKQQYFNAAIISKDAFDNDADLRWTDLKDTGMVKQMYASMYLNYELEEQKTFNLKFYFGPNHFQTLKQLNVGIEEHGLQRIVPLGWGIFGWVNRFVVIPVFNFLDDYILNMGIIILLLTLIIKSLLLPLVYKSYISMAKMRILKPELEEIKEKHAGDLQKMQADNMALYRKAGVSPMSGCVPMLLQMPILFAMFQFFPNAFELRQKTFLWSSDLSQYDSILDLGFSIPFYGDHVSLFTLLMTVSTLIYTRLNNQISGVTGQMKWIGYLMPVIFLGVLNDYASGLTWYYFVSNMVTFGQQAILRRTVNDKKLHAQIAEARKKPVKKSAFQERMELAMKQAQNKQAQGKRPGIPPKGGKKKN